MLPINLKYYKLRTGCPLIAQADSLFVAKICHGPHQKLKIKSDGAALLQQAARNMLMLYHADVVCTLSQEVHEYGLRWFEKRRSISFLHHQQQQQSRPVRAATP